MEQKQRFYEELAASYHLMFDNWDESMASQGKVLATILPPINLAGPVLDCACGIGTQALALANLGYQVEASDLYCARIDS